MENIRDVDIQRINENDFQLLKNLGKGTYGQVFMARERKTGKIVAQKLLRKDRTKLDDFLHELFVSIYLSSYEGIIVSYSLFIDSVDHYVLTQDLAPAGSLHSIIEPCIGIPEVIVKRCALQLTNALEYMHSKGLVHRDLKPDNVLLMDKECHQIKLSDFGMTQVTGNLVPAMSPAIPYMSPELCKLKRHETLALDPSVDIWALGVLLYVAFTGYFPWKRAAEDDQLFQGFVNWQSFVDHVPPPRHWNKFNTKTHALFHVLLAQDPKSRNPITVVLNHLECPWGVEDIPEETSEIVIQEDDFEIRNDEHEVIIIEGEEEFIVVENHGDLNCIIFCETTDESLSGFSDPTMLFLIDSTDLALGSEVEVIQTSQVEMVT